MTHSMICSKCKEPIPEDRVTAKVDHTSEIEINVTCSCGTAWFAFVSFDDLIEDKPF